MNKFKIIILSLFLLLLSFSACKSDADEASNTFLATVVEISDNTATVEPLAGEDECSDNPKIYLDIKYIDFNADIWDVVEITYKGVIKSSPDTPFKPEKTKVCNDLRQVKYQGNWLDKDNAEKLNGGVYSKLIITQIYADCFFAETTENTEYIYKFNGVLGEEWCIGDEFYISCENVYEDDINKLVEADFKILYAYNPFADAKPVIYLYPEQEIFITVKLDLDGEFTCTYPEYNDSWTVTAMPDGTLTDEKGQTYNYLYWEGESNTRWDMSKGFCIKGEDTAAFLEKALAELGLTRREANEFIVYWLPLMQDNSYNVISFQTELYESSAKLSISPTPDTLIRVFMAYYSSETFVNIAPQQLVSPERNGFVAVEWGGALAE